MDFFNRLFDTSGFFPRWDCGQWSESQGWLHIFSDLGIWGAYFTIPCILVFFVLRRRDIPFPSVFWLFGAFILACGTTHLMEVIIFWHPFYRLAGVIKLLTAIASWGTVVALVPIVPKALAMRSPEELEREISARKEVEAQLQRTNAELERRVQERTAELARANAVLQIEREMLRITLASIGDGVITTDTEGRVSFLNPVAEDLSGWKQGDAATKPLGTVLQLINEQSRRPVENPAHRVLRDGAVVGLANHTLLIARDGSERPIEDSAAPIRAENGDIKGVVLVFRDASERRRLDRLQHSYQADLEKQVRERTEQLQISEEKFRLLVDGTRDYAIIMLDPEGKVASWNPGAERINQHQASEILGQHFSRFYTPEDVDAGKPAQALQTAAAEGRYEEEGWRMRKDGSRFWSSAIITALRDANGNLRGFSKITRDITAKKEAEGNALRLLQEEAARRAAEGYAQLMERQREQLRVTLASIGDGVITTDAEGRVTMLNPVAEALTGWTHAHAAGKPLAEVFRIINESTRKTIENPAAKVLTEGRIVGLANHTVLIARDGKERPIDDSAAPIKNEQGQVVGVVLVFHDVTERRRVEATLRRIREELQIVTDSMSVPVTRCSRDFKYLWMNRHYAHWLGREMGEIIGANIIDIIGKTAFEQLRPFFERALSGETVHYEEQVHFQGIGPRWVNVVYTPTLGADGTPDGWVAVVLDLQNRKRMEQALRDSEERLAGELDAMTRLHSLSTRLLAGADLNTAMDDVLECALATTHADFGNIQVFDPDKRLLHIVAQRGFQQDFLDHFHAVRMDDGWACARALQEGRRIIIEDVQSDSRFAPHREIAAAAGFRAVQSTPLKNRNNDILGILSTHNREPQEVSDRDQRLLDLLARHAADFIGRLRGEEVLQESVRRESERAAELIAIMSATPTPIWIALDPQCQHITGNPASYRLLGLPEDANVSASSPVQDPAKRGFREFRGDEPIPAEQLPVQMAAKGVPVTDAEMKLVFDDGRVRYIYGNAVPLFNPDGSVRGSIAAFSDITALKEADAALKEAARRKDEFLATLAHELRNPLAPIRNGLELMKRAAGNAGLIEQIRVLMERQVGQMVRLIDDLLDLSRISRGKVVLRKERVDLASVVRSEIDASRYLMDARSQEFTVALPAETICLDADPTRLSQIISNLLNNAAKYTDKGGHIWLTVRQQDGQAILSVRDTGIGIAAEHLLHIFEMFTQAVPALERSEGGLGVGLALVKGLVELHGGAIEAHSDGLGKGSEFIVRLPIAERAATRSSSDESHSPPQSAPRRRILVVDDNRDAADSLAMMLHIKGHEVQTAYDGVEAAQTAAIFHPNVALLDIGMPKMNGYELAQHIRKQPWASRVVLIALTGWGQEEDKKRATEAGFDFHMSKPVQPDYLEKLLNDVPQRTS